MFLPSSDLKRLQPPYRRLIKWLEFLCMAIASLPLCWFAAWLAHRFGISVHTPVRDQPHGLLYPGLVLLAFVFLLSASYLAVFASLALVLRWRAGWSSAQAYRLVFRSEVPPSWLKPPPHA